MTAAAAAAIRTSPGAVSTMRSLLSLPARSTSFAAVSPTPPETTPMRSFCAPDAFSTLARSLSCTSTLVLSHTITSTASCSSAAKAAS